MRFRIHQGAHEVGGNCIEIESAGLRILLDVGLPLNENDKPLPDLLALSAPGSGLVGVLLSHTHGDHCGLMANLHPGTPLFVGEKAWNVFCATAPFLSRSIPDLAVAHYHHRQCFRIGPFSITPYLNDHSAFDAYSFVIESAGRRVFYSGDFRGHGKRKWMFDDLLNKPPESVNLLLIEGTNVGSGKDRATGEDEIQNQLTEAMLRTEGIVLVMVSPLNFDRMFAIALAAESAGRKFVVDAYSLAALEAADVASTRRLLGVLQFYVPQRQRITLKNNALTRLVDTRKERRLFERDLSQRRRELVLLFRGDMRDKLSQETFVGARIIYSMWAGYLARDRTGLRSWAGETGIPVEHVHTTGHACRDDLRRLHEALRPQLTVPVHTDCAGDFLPLINGPVRLPRAGEWIEVPE